MITKTVKPASPKQLELIKRVAPERELAGMPDWAIDTLADVMGDKDVIMSDASALIDELFAAPRIKTAAQAALTEGLYIAPDSTVIKLQKSKTSGNLYAKVATTISGERLNLLGEKVKFEYTYSPGLVRHIIPQMKMTADQALEYGIKYSRCMWCGRGLKAADSVAKALGPVCAKRFE